MLQHVYGSTVYFDTHEKIWIKEVNTENSTIYEPLLPEHKGKGLGIEKMHLISVDDLSENNDILTARELSQNNDTESQENDIESLSNRIITEQKQAGKKKYQSVIGGEKHQLPSIIVDTSSNIGELSKQIEKNIDSLLRNTKQKSSENKYCDLYEKYKNVVESPKIEEYRKRKILTDILETTSALMNKQKAARKTNRIKKDQVKKKKNKIFYRFLIMVFAPTALTFLIFFFIGLGHRKAPTQDTIVVNSDNCTDYINSYMYMNDTVLTQWRKDQIQNAIIYQELTETEIYNTIHEIAIKKY